MQGYPEYYFSCSFDKGSNGKQTEGKDLSEGPVHTGKWKMPEVVVSSIRNFLIYVALLLRLTRISQRFLLLCADELD